jgi:hypothetical protein
MPFVYGASPVALPEKMVMCTQLLSGSVFVGPLPNLCARHSNSLLGILWPFQIGVAQPFGHEVGSTSPINGSRGAARIPRPSS